MNETFESEVRQAFRNFEERLDLSGMRKNQVMKCTVFLTKMSNYAAVNALYTEFFEGHRPARSCVAVFELPRGAQFEIEAVAADCDEQLSSPKL